MTLEKCSDREATIEFSLKPTLVSANISGQETLSQMSEAMSMDSGPESEYDMNDFENDNGAGTSSRGRIGGKISGRKPASMLKTTIKYNNDPSKPPMMLGKFNSTGFDPS
jgi:hypothetical protein